MPLHVKVATNAALTFTSEIQVNNFLTVNYFGFGFAFQRYVIVSLHL